MLNNTEWPINNIFKRLASKTQNANRHILYHKHNSSFDNIIKNIGDKYLYIDSSNNYHMDYNFDYTIFNSALIQSKDLYGAYETCTQIIVFNHDDLSGLKKEDVYILNRNLRSVDARVINFNPKSNSVIENSFNINYPIRTFNKPPNKTKDVLVINTSQNNILTNIYNDLKQKQYDIDIATSLGTSEKYLFNLISKYKVVIEMFSRINVLYSIFCKCSVVTQMDLDGFPENKNIIKFDRYDNIENKLNSAIVKNAPEFDNLKKIYSEDSFLNTMKEFT